MEIQTHDLLRYGYVDYVMLGLSGCLKTLEMQLCGWVKTPLLSELLVNPENAVLWLLKSTEDFPPK